MPPPGSNRPAPQTTPPSGRYTLSASSPLTEAAAVFWKVVFPAQRKAGLAAGGGKVCSPRA